ncbi:MAG: branched-chain-amino-acid transaminase [Peptococcaceae bacterium]|nr:branched-chain-amino-acid transaminase [Peptococcaceae bacterium]
MWGKQNEGGVYLSNIIYIDGHFVPKEEAKISVYDHGLLYGDGIFEGLRVYNGRIFKLEEHVDRLYESAKSIMLTIPMPKQEMIAAHVETVRQNGLRDVYIRSIVTRGVGSLGIDPRSCPKASVIIIVDKISLYPAELYEKGIDVVTVATRRPSVDVLSPRVKSLNYLNNVMAKIEAARAGAFGGIMLNSEGYVTEGTADNIFLVKKGIIYTPPGHVGILQGITRDTIMTMAAESGYVVKEEVFTRHDIYVADEVFFTGSGAEVIPVINCDGRVIGTGTPGTVTRYFIEEYRKLVNSTGYPVFTS